MIPYLAPTASVADYCIYSTVVSSASERNDGVCRVASRHRRWMEAHGDRTKAFKVHATPAVGMDAKLELIHRTFARVPPPLLQLVGIDALPNNR